MNSTTVSQLPPAKEVGLVERDRVAVRVRLPSRRRHRRLSSLAYGEEAAAQKLSPVWTKSLYGTLRTPTGMQPVNLFPLEVEAA